MSNRSFSQFISECNEVLLSTIGLGVNDIGDAEWRMYFDEEYDAKEACAYALYDYNDMPYDLLCEIGLGKYI